jgi:hypothetical protein
VVSDIAAAIRSMKFDAGAGQNFSGRENVVVVTVAAHGDDVGMLDEEKLVGDFAAFTLVHELALQVEGFGVTHAA